MKVKEIMTKDPAFCTPETGLQTAAKMMCDGNYGELPVLEDRQALKPVGVITDRDIVCRAVAQNKETSALSVSDCMSSPAVTVTPDTDIEDCYELMSERQIRRLPVVDKNGRCVGIVAQADIARSCPPHKAGEVVRQVSQASA